MFLHKQVTIFFRMLTFSNSKSSIFLYITYAHTRFVSPCQQMWKVNFCISKLFFQGNIGTCCVYKTYGLNIYLCVSVQWPLWVLCVILNQIISKNYLVSAKPSEDSIPCCTKVPKLSKFRSIILLSKIINYMWCNGTLSQRNKVTRIAGGCGRGWTKFEKQSKEYRRGLHKTMLIEHQNSEQCLKKDILETAPFFQDFSNSVQVVCDYPQY